MKVEYVQVTQGFGLAWFWIWRCGGAASEQCYTRRRDAVRGFERFCAAIRGVK